MHSSAIAGACAGLVSSVVTCPLDVVKTKLQAQSGRAGKGGANAGVISPAAAALRGDMIAEEGARYVGISGTLRKIWRDDGFRGFYRGLGPTIFGYLPTWAIYFTVYDKCKQVLAEDISSSGEEDFINHILSAMTAGAASTICTSPLWVVKTRFMLQSAKDKNVTPYRHTGDAFVQIFRTEGLRGFYKGLLPSLFGVSHVAVQFPLYENFKSIARERLGSEDLPPSTILLCSSSAKMIASVTTYPHEVLRTRLQMQPRNHSSSASSHKSASSPSLPSSSSSSSSSSPAPFSSSSSESSSNATTRRSIHTTSRTIMNAAATGTWMTRAAVEGLPEAGSGSDPNQRRRISSMGNRGVGGRYTGVIQACKTIAREEGIRGFYKGMAVNLVRTVPSSALTILTYEVIMQHLTQMEQDSESRLHPASVDGGGREEVEKI
ncbi:mitochondrial carrier [Violaceomyces palustris]|uniref:Mitochondrial carrier n=1 Tax=Violaceomyces palustris TaxID=1673888 RepID=A0ACD0NMC1_9BASI|nr:mitochondrial carrier [Violaceomyces palustris]